jgi:hypothetical protein
VTADERFCLQCGAPVDESAEDPAVAAGLLPPFDADRFRRDVAPETSGRTVPAWVLVAVIVVGLAAGVVLGAAR